MFGGSEEWNLRMILDNTEALPHIYAKVSLLQADTSYANSLKMYDLGLIDEDELNYRTKQYNDQYKAVETFLNNRK